MLIALNFPSFRQANELVTSFVMQLEAVELWTWAIYVVLHLPDEQHLIKERAVREILARNIHSVTAVDEKFMLEQLHIPSQWIDEAKVWHPTPYILPLGMVVLLQARSTVRSAAFDACSSVGTRTRTNVNYSRS